MSRKQIISALAAVLLLFSWLSQQFLFERWNGRLADLRAALGTYQTYQSNNALFNALRPLTPIEQRDGLWQLQSQNYRSGLTALRQALATEREPELRKAIEQRTAEYMQSLAGRPELGGRTNEVASVQAQLEVLQEELQREEQDIERKKTLSQRVLWAFYILGSLLVLVAGLLHE
jgi:hypothetical protein